MVKNSLSDGTYEAAIQAAHPEHNQEQRPRSLNRVRCLTISVRGKRPGRTTLLSAHKTALSLLRSIVDLIP
jgi:hypothetical protein